MFEEGDEYMKKILKIAGIALVAAILAVAWIGIGDSKAKPFKADFAYHYVVTQGLGESGMEKVEVNGTIWNCGNKETGTIAISALFIDEAHCKIVEEPIEMKRSLLPGEHVDINAEYLREKTIPKCSVKVKIKVDWMEDGKRKVKILPPVKSSVSAGLVDFEENIDRYHDRFVLELIPTKKGDYEVIYLFRENDEPVICGDEVFSSISDENPITFSFPANESSYIEYHVEIFTLDGTLLDEMHASTKVVRGGQ